MYTSWEKENMLVTSNFSCFHDFYSYLSSTPSILENIFSLVLQILLNFEAFTCNTAYDRLIHTFSQSEVLNSNLQI